MKNIQLWIVWANGAVGKEMISCLEELKIPIWELKLWGSHRSAWLNLNTHLWERIIQETNNKFFDWLEYVLFAAGWNISKQYSDIALKAWAKVIDNSSAFRYDPWVPLVIPQINSYAIWDANIIANPNCTTAIAAVVLFPIYQKYWLKKIIMSTYQATSGAWKLWIDELIENTKNYFNWDKPTISQFPYDIAFNVLPHIDSFQENGYTKEEMKVVWETQKIFSDKLIDISCTAVRVPTLRAHSESIILQTDKPVNIQDIRSLLDETPGVEVRDEISKNIYPMPINASGKFNVEVWRLRKSLIFWDHGLELFISWDQLLRWAALNAVEILRECVSEKVCENIVNIDK